MSDNFHVVGMIGGTDPELATEYMTSLEHTLQGKNSCSIT